MFNIVNDNKQLTRFTWVFSHHHRSIELSHWSHDVQEVCTSFQLSHRVFLGLSALIIHVQRKCLFLWTLQTIHWLIFLHVQADHDGRKQFLRSMQKILWSREVMQRKPRKSFLKLSLRKHPFLLALRRWDVSRGGTSATQQQKFHTYDTNQCLHNKSGSHGVPNTKLSNFTCLLVNFGKVLCSSANKLWQ